jgi:hypothetical protein
MAKGHDKKIRVNKGGASYNNRPRLKIDECLSVVVVDAVYGDNVDVSGLPCIGTLSAGTGLVHLLGNLLAGLRIEDNVAVV